MHHLQAASTYPRLYSVFGKSPTIAALIDDIKESMRQAGSPLARALRSFHPVVDRQTA